MTGAIVMMVPTIAAIMPNTTHLVCWRWRGFDTCRKRYTCARTPAASHPRTQRYTRASPQLSTSLIPLGTLSAGTKNHEIVYAIQTPAGIQAHFGTKRPFG